MLHTFDIERPAPRIAAFVGAASFWNPYLEYVYFFDFTGEAVESVLARSLNTEVFH
jgi:hypothetical protein